MMRDIVLFEKEFDGVEKLGFRLTGQTLPMGSTPVAVVADGIVTVLCGTMVSRDIVVDTAMQVALGKPRLRESPFVSPAEGL